MNKSCSILVSTFVEGEHSQSISTLTSQSCYRQLSKELLAKASLRKVAHPVSRSYSSFGSMSQLNERDTELTTIRERTSQKDEPTMNVSISSSSGTTSIILDHKHQSSSKIYNEYKRRASLINLPTDKKSTVTHSHSTIIHPMHSHIGLRSSTSSSSIKENINDRSHANKQMNICVINQLNEHLSTRFRYQHVESSISTNRERMIDSNSQHYDESVEEFTENIPSNVYDEPHQVDTVNISSVTCHDQSMPSKPPPPPPYVLSLYFHCSLMFVRYCFHNDQCHEFNDSSTYSFRLMT
jgi:hypothetical protein